jgi:penicillin-binding protein 1A
MAVAHTDMNIPNLPGLEPHPVQVAEQQRLEELKRSDPQLAAALEGQQETGPKSSSLMTESTKSALSRIAAAMRKASGVAAPPDAPGKQGDATKVKPPPARDSRADTGAAAPGAQSAGLSPPRPASQDPQRPLTP